MLRPLCLLILMMFCFGCGTVKTRIDEFNATVHEDLIDLRAFTVEDIRRAGALAAARGDLAAATCFPALAAHVESAAQRAAPSDGSVTIGVFEVFEHARLIIRPPVPKSDALDVACAALRAQVERDVVKLIVKSAASVGTGGIGSGGDMLTAFRTVIGVLRALRVDGAEVAP